MEINTIEKESIKIFLVLLIISGIVSAFLHSISYSLGLVLGYLLNLFIFRVIQVEADAILNSYGKLTVGLIIIISLAKLGIYALGFLLAIKCPNFFNLFSVFVGYFVIKLTIFYMGYRTRKE